MGNELELRFIYADIKKKQFGNEREIIILPPTHKKRHKGLTRLFLLTLSSLKAFKSHNLYYTYLESLY